MIPFRLNVLSPAKRRYHSRVVYVELVKSALELLLIIICVCGMAILAGLTILRNHFVDMSSTIIIATSPYIQKNREITHINEILARTDAIQNEYVLWTPLLSELALAIPQEITLTTLDIDMEKNELHITGSATTRQALLNLEQRLEEIPWIDEITVPLSQLIVPEPIPFSLETTIVK